MSQPTSLPTSLPSLKAHAIASTSCRGGYAYNAINTYTPRVNSRGQLVWTKDRELATFTAKAKAKSQSLLHQFASTDPTVTYVSLVHGSLHNQLIQPTTLTEVK